MVRIALVDDEIRHNNTLADMLREIIDKRQIGARIDCLACSPRAALDFAKSSNEPQLFFLDIELNDTMNGIELCKRIHAINSSSLIVYISAYPHYAMQCLQSHAYDFLLKPFTREQLAESLSAAISFIESKKPLYPLSVTAGSQTHILDQSNIIYFEKDHVYLIAHMVSGSITWRGSFKLVIPMLEDGIFHLIHRSYLVNQNYISSCDWGDGSIILSNGNKLPFSRRLQKKVKTAIMA